MTYRGIKLLSIVILVIGSLLKNAYSQSQYGISINFTPNYTQQESAESAIFVSFIPAYQPPAQITDLTDKEVSTSTITLGWTAPGDNGTIGEISSGEYNLQYSQTDTFVSLTEIIWSTNIIPGNIESKEVAGLNANTTYYFRLKTADSNGNWANWSPVRGAHTLSSVVSEYLSVIYQNAVLEGSTTNVYLTVVDTTTASIAIAVSSAAEAGFGVFGEIYDIKPNGVVFTPPAKAKFYYIEPLPPGVSDESLLNVYKYKSGAWQVIPKLQQSIAENWIEVEIDSLSVFAILYPDMAAPVTQALISGTTGQNGWNISPVTITLISADAVSGVAQVVFQLDDNPYIVYDSSLIVSAEGSHLIKFKAIDKAGNTETEKSIAFKIDLTTPSLSYLLKPGQNTAGWNNTSVKVIFTGTDPISGIDTCTPEQTVSIEGGSQAVTGSCMDIAGNVAYTTATVSVDLTKPKVSAAMSPLPNETGWHNGPTEIAFTGIDGLSGINYCSPQTIVTVEGSSIPESGYCLDNAGNSSTATVTVNIDITTPRLTYTALPPANTFGWNNSDVTVGFSCSDELSGVGICPEGILLTGEGVGISTFAFASDLAGNMGWAEVSGIKIDRTVPVSTTVLTGVYRNGWYSASVKAVIASTDALAGVKEIMYSLDGGAYGAYSMPLNVSGDGEHSLKYYAVDNAGNVEEEKSVAFNIDSSLPEISFSQTPVANEKGWNNTSVQIVFAGSDTLSGIEVCSSATVAVEGGTQHVPGWCRDVAGNIAYTTATLNIDLTKPEASAITVPSANEYGWNNGLVEVSFAGSDALSGLASCESPKTVFVQGSSMAVGGYCTDNAGNSSTATVTVSIDTAAPSLSYTALPSANEAGWNNTDVVVNFTCSDALSGVASCPAGLVLSLEGVDVSTVAEVYDYAGNLSTVPITLNIDKTAPEVIISSPAAGGLYSVGVETLAIRLAVEDNIDTSPVVTAMLTQAEDNGTPRGGRPASITVANGQDLDPLALDDGLWRLEVTAGDIAGNSTQAVSGLFKVIHDTIAPQTALVVGQPQFTDGVVYINSDTPLTSSTTDDLLVEGDRLGGGATFTYISLDGGVAAAVEGAFHISIEGVHAVAWYSVDKAGNTEAEKSALLYVDNSAPETAYSITGPIFESVAGLYVSTVSAISLAAAEPPSSGAASGLATVFIADSTDTYAVYAASFTVSEGGHLYSYYAKDRLGNTGTAKTLALTADGTPPASNIAYSAAPSSGISGRLVISSDTYLGFEAQDALSGVGSVLYSVDGAAEAVFESTFTLAAGPHEVSWRAVDNVGNAEAAQVVTLQVGGVELRQVAVSFEPSTINLKSEGRYIEASLTVSGAGRAEFDIPTIRLTRINDVALAAPIYAIEEHEDKGEKNGRNNAKDNKKDNDGKDKNNGKGSDKDKGKDKGKDEENDKDRRYKKTLTITVKFDRQALIAVLPVDRQVKVTVEGGFDDGTAFLAEDYLRVINPGRVDKWHGGKVRHNSRACAEVPARALKEDADITVVALAERDRDRREREERAGDKGLTRRGEPYEFGPEGTKFDKDVIISLPYETYEEGKVKLSIAYWNPSRKEWEPLESELDAKEKVVKAKVSHFSVYQVVASAPPAGRRFRSSEDTQEEGGPSSEFRLGEVYVFPNPALRGAEPTLHIETGIADTVTLAIYTVSGRKAHEHTLTGLPAVIDNGNGSSYAYEYAWRGHIPSGVYFYHIEAQKAGQKLKKTGKFSVVR